MGSHTISHILWMSEPLYVLTWKISYFPVVFTAAGMWNPKHGSVSLCRCASRTFSRTLIKYGPKLHQG